MDSKATKDTVPPLILPRFKNMDLVFTIEARLRACASIGQLNLTRSERWILSEWRVAQERALVYGEKLLAHRERTPFGEIDLLFENGERVLQLIEVKSWQRELWGESVVSPRQARRLKRARDWVEDSFQRPTALLLAVVSHDSIAYFEAGCGWLTIGN